GLRGRVRAGRRHHPGAAGRGRRRRVGGGRSPPRAGGARPRRPPRRRRRRRGGAQPGGARARGRRVHLRGRRAPGPRPPPLPARAGRPPIPRPLLGRSSDMALRIATLETQPRTAPPRTAREWQRAVARAAAAAAEAVRARDPGALARAYAEARGFQARRLATEAVLAEGARLPGLSWRPVYAAAARALLDALEEAPSEPVLLNCAGVFCYELGELRGARALFEAARRLDPALPHVAANLDAVRARA